MLLYSDCKWRLAPPERFLLLRETNLELPFAVLHRIANGHMLTLHSPRGFRLVHRMKPNTRFCAPILAGESTIAPTSIQAPENMHIASHLPPAACSIALEIVEPSSWPGELHTTMNPVIVASPEFPKRREQAGAKRDMNLYRNGFALADY